MVFIHHTDFRLMQSVIMTTNSIILLLVLYTSCLCSTRDVYIQPSEGEHCPGTPCYNISTFGRMAHNNFSNSSGLAVHFLEGTHLLDLQELVVFTNLTNVTFKGDNGRMEQGFHETVWQSTVVIKCTEHSSTGIGFVNSSNITFRYITITNCGADMTTNLSNVSLGFLNVGNGIIIDHVSVQNGSGNGLTVISDGVNLLIVTSSFAHNGYEEACNILILYIDPHNCGNPQKHVYNTFITNTNVSQVQFRHSRWPSVGLAMKFLQASYSVTAILDSVILDSVMVYKNIGMIVISSINVPNYNLTINNSRISDADDFALFVKTTSRIFENNKLYSNTNNNIINIFIINSQFFYNKGACYFKFQGINHPVNITIRSTEFSHNMVTSYKHIDPLTRSASMLHFSSYAYQEQVRIFLQNVTINNNSFSWSKNDIKNTSLLQASAMHAEFVNLVLNNVKIINNNATGLLCYSTVVLVNSNSTSVFHNNTGIDGGGLAMYGDSYILFEDNSILKFTKNKAEQRGGAIFINTILPISPCFYQYTEGTHSQSTKAFFFGNNANTAGTAIFGGDRYCLLFADPGNYSIAGNCFHETFDYSAQTGPSVISSEPTDVCFCDDNNTINCSQTQLTMTAYPGEEINIYVVTVGQKDGVAPGLLQIQPLSDASGKVMTYQTVAMNCTTITFTPIDVNYSLTTITHSPSYNTLRLSIEKTDCPFGFRISNKTGFCDCKDLKRNASTIKCDATTGTISRQGDAWIGNISNCIVIQSPCPLDYCRITKSNFSLADPDPQCALNRMGILCGGCRKNFSLVLGTNECKHCPDPFRLSLIIPFAAAGFGLVALLMVLNLTVSIGTINGLIFYASIVKISESTGIFFPNGLIPVLSQFIAWLNLDLGIETCFYPGMTAYHKVWLQFVFPLYIWFIIATIIVLCRYSTWLSNKIGGNVVQVLATLILLSFTKIFRTFAPALTWVELSCEKNVTTKWYVDGNISYFSSKHYTLLAAAVLFLLLAVPYTLALLFDAAIEKYLTKMRFFRRQWIKFKPFVDAYHGPYKDNCRFWTGLLLLVRMSFTLVSLHMGTYATLVFVTTSTSVLLSLMVFFGGVYQKNYLNILECPSLLNLALLSAIYNPWYDSFKETGVDVTIISVSAAFAMFIGVIIYHTFILFKNLKCFKKFANTRSNSEPESERLLDDDEKYVCKQLVQPTSSDVWMKREPLIYS